MTEKEFAAAKAALIERLRAVKGRGDSAPRGSLSAFLLAGLGMLAFGILMIAGLLLRIPGGRLPFQSTPESGMSNRA